MRSNILIIDDDNEVRSLISDVLSDEGYATFVAANGNEAFFHLKNTGFDLIFLDLWLDDDESAGLKIIEKIKKLNNEVPVVIISGHGTIDTAVSAIKKGAFDFIEKPFVIDRLLITADRAVEFYRLRKENSRLRINKIDTSIIGVGESQFSQSLKTELDKIATSNSRVFIETSTGIGADNVAYYIHKKSSRNKYPFVYFNCSTDEEDKLRDDLFGSEKARGYIEKANFGTLFLDNIAELSKNNQRRLLQFIQENKLEIETRGSYFDVRIICSNVNVDISEQNFNQELFYRLNIVKIVIPPLKERREDIIPLANYYLQNAESFFGLKPKTLSDESAVILQSYDWPGNICQLKSIIENSLMNASEKLCVEKIDLPAELTTTTKEKFDSLNISKLISLPLKKAKEAFESDYLRAQITRFSGNISRTAEFIGMERSALHRKLKSLGIR